MLSLLERGWAMGLLDFGRGHGASWPRSCRALARNVRLRGKVF